MSKFIRLTVIGDGSIITNQPKLTFIGIDHIVEFAQREHSSGFHPRHARIVLATRDVLCVAEDAHQIALKLGWGDSNDQA